ncbi:hypothetical protein, partial [Listeria monocytogenes]|uniref:hypothetical protein n=1 Tax=Listeria monocytogenes TaxID=1639 RepID=UPI002FDC1463
GVWLSGGRGMKPTHRPGDPRREPLLTDRPNPWADDREPGCGLARAIVIVVATVIFVGAVWSVLK